MIRSMTGYGRGEVEAGGYRFLAEIKSVNHRFLNTHIRLPREFSHLESFVAARCATRCERGVGVGSTRERVGGNGYLDETPVGDPREHAVHRPACERGVVEEMNDVEAEHAPIRAGHGERRQLRPVAHLVGQAPAEPGDGTLVAQEPVQADVAPGEQGDHLLRRHLIGFRAERKTILSASPTM